MTTETPSRTVASSVGRRLLDLAGRDPSGPAVTTRSRTHGWQTLTRSQLCAQVRHAAGVLRTTAGPDEQRVVIDLPNGPGFVVAVLATWWAGRVPVVIPPGATGEERAALFQDAPHAVPAVSFSDEPLRTALSEPPPRSQGPEPVAEAAEAWHLPSGGSTGLPRLVPAVGSPLTVLSSQQLLLSAVGWTPGGVQMVVGPLFHAAPFISAFGGLAAGDHIVLPDRFAPAVLAAGIERFPPHWCQLTPHQMQLIAADPKLAALLCRELRALMHTAAPCPEDVKRDWIARVGGDRLHEMYGATQMIGVAVCNGTQWLHRPGTVGRPFMTQVRILDRNGRRLPPGQQGEVVMRSAVTRRLPAAMAARMRRHAGGFYGVGDLGYLDADGYLFLTDRLDDVIIVGGANVSAREVENTLRGHPKVRDVVVTGRPHAVLGQAVHATVACDPAQPVTLREARDHCGGLLAAHKVPVTLEVLHELARSRSGKVERFRYAKPMEQ
ncbi:MAG: AMP-binding protein [Streptomyces sp.]|nr:AMP-binding protein [Streptomyces sp.]